MWLRNMPVEETNLIWVVCFLSCSSILHCYVYPYIFIKATYSSLSSSIIYKRWICRSATNWCLTSDIPLQKKFSSQRYPKQWKVRSHASSWKSSSLFYASSEGNYKHCISTVYIQFNTLSWFTSNPLHRL